MKGSSEFVSKNRVKVKKIKHFLRELKEVQHSLEDQVWDRIKQREKVPAVNGWRL